MTAAPILAKLEALPKARQVRPGAWAGCCPAHEDHSPSLSWTTGEDGRVLIRCHKSCSVEAIVDAMGATMTDLFAPKTNGAAGPARISVTTKRIVATYDYTDEAGDLLYQSVRYDPKDFRQRRPDGDGWSWSLNGTRRVLYRLPALLAAPGAPVVVVEGEKDADRLADLGILATTSPMGARKWRPEYADALRGRPIYVIPDNDDLGRGHAADVVRSLPGEDARIVELPGLAPKGDVSDWLDAGHTVDELRAVLAEAITFTPPVGPTIASALAAVETFLRRFVVFGRPEAIVAVVLWIAHTYALEFAVATPYLAVTSPEKGSGKTRLLECLRLLARGRPEIFIIPTASTIYRMLEADPDAPLLLDELDAVFRDRSDKYEEVRAIINAGHRRGAKVPRTVSTGNKHEIKMFPVFGPRALAGIGKLPDTVADRSIPVRMLKKKRSEKVEKFRDAGASREAATIVTALESAMTASSPGLEADVPDELPDRAADAWEPLLAIADTAGGPWPARARAAAIILHADRADDDSLGLRMLADTRLVFDRLEVDRLATTALIDELKSDEESPWVDEHKPLTAVGLAGYLRPFGIRSKQVKFAGVNVRGFLRESFVDSWDRYLPESATPPPDPLPRYPERADGSGVAGYEGGSGSLDDDRGYGPEDDYPPSAWADDPAPAPLVED